MTRWQCFPAILAPRSPDAPGLVRSRAPRIPGPVPRARRGSLLRGYPAGGGVRIPAGGPVPGRPGGIRGPAGPVPAGPREIADSRAGRRLYRPPDPCRRRACPRGGDPDIPRGGPGNGEPPRPGAPGDPDPGTRSRFGSSSRGIPGGRGARGFRRIRGYDGPGVPAGSRHPGRVYRGAPRPSCSWIPEPALWASLVSPPSGSWWIRLPRTSFPGPGDIPFPEALLAAYAGRPGVPGAAASLAREGKPEAALALLEGRSEPEAPHLAGILFMSEGQGARALAALGAAERRSLWLPGLAESLALCEEAFRSRSPGAGSASPAPYPGLGFDCSIGGLPDPAGDRTFSGARPGGRNAIPGAGGMDAPGRRRPCSPAHRRFRPGAADRIRCRRGHGSLVGSLESGTRAESFLGRSGVLATVTPDWALLRFPDGRSAWFRSGDYLRY
ncbi:MAG: hypothetical protein MZU79_00480 [Anaerotruncus sp.]|nr:hypothetical protein [Anaerotruncus sp.]